MPDNMTLQLQRHLAPFGPEIWDDIDDTARRIARTHLSARRLFGVHGPLGLDVAALNTGRHREVGSDEASGLDWAIREAQPLLEIRRDFTVPHEAITAAIRGAGDPDWDAIEETVDRITTFEETAVYTGLPAQGITGILTTSDHQALHVANDPIAILDGITRAHIALLAAGMPGPFALVAGRSFMNALAQTLPHSGRAVRSHAANRIDGDVVWSPGLDDAVLVSRAEGNFALTLGHDLALGYNGEGDDATRLFAFESFTFRTLEPRAAITLQLES